MICVAAHYDCELISSVTVNLPYIESVAVKITHQNKTIIVSEVYRPPNRDFDWFHSFVENKVPIRKYSTSDHTVCEDFNLNLLNVHQIQNNASMFYNDMPTNCYLLYRDRLV